MAILTSYMDSYNVSMIKENKNSLLVIFMAISQIQNAPNVDDFGITETKPNHFYLSSCF
jgi:hypothetical protein